MFKTTPTGGSRTLLAAALVLACGAAAAQGLRLGPLLEMARGADAQYASARAAAASGREKLPQAQAGLRPSVTLSQAFRQTHDGSSRADGTLRYLNVNTSLVMSQPLFRVANKIAVEQAEFQVEATDQQLAIAEQDLLLRVARAYFDVLQGADEVAAAVAQRSALEQQLGQARRSFEVGTVPITDLNEAQSRHDIAVAQEIAARNELESRRRVVERSIGRPLPPPARLKDDAAVDLLDAGEQRRLVDAAAQQSLAVRVARTLVAVADKEVARRDAAHVPTLDMVVSAGAVRNANAGAGVLQDTRQASVGLEFGFPLYQGGAVSSRVREAVADRLRAEDDLLQAQRQAVLDAQQAQLGVQSGAALVKALRQALTSGESVLRSTQRGFQVGIRTRVDVLNAEQQLYATRREFANARFRTLFSSLQLKSAAGELGDNDLRAIDTLLGD